MWALPPEPKDAGAYTVCYVSCPAPGGQLHICPRAGVLCLCGLSMQCWREAARGSLLVACRLRSRASVFPVRVYSGWPNCRMRHAVAETMDVAVPPAPNAVLLYKLHVTPSGEPAQPVSHARRCCQDSLVDRALSRQSGLECCPRANVQRQARQQHPARLVHVRTPALVETCVVTRP